MISLDGRNHELQTLFELGMLLLKEGFPIRQMKSAEIENMYGLRDDHKLHSTCAHTCMSHCGHRS